MELVDAPKVFCIGYPQIDTEEMLTYLREIGGESWFDRVFHTYGSSGSHALSSVPPAEGLVEFMGRLCYRSWEPGLNRNVTKIREDRGDYLLNILRSAHGSVLEHAVFNFVIHNGSRVFTAEMNRHKAGTAISEQSLRYVRLDNLGFWEPPDLSAETLVEGQQLIRAFEEFYKRAVEREFTDEMPFDQKKKITSSLRRWAPLGLATEEGWSANIRAIRHVIEMRTAAHAEAEISLIVNQIAKIMQTKCPLLFGDYFSIQSISDNGSPVWSTEFRKV